LNQDTNLVVTAPDGAALTNTIPASIMDVWKTIPNMQFAVGIMPGDPARIGQMATLKGVNITGAAGELNSSFLGVPLDTNVWSIVASSPAYGVQENPTAGSLWLGWTLPANNFRLQTNATLTSGSWVNAALGGFDAGGKHSILIRQGDLPSSDAGFFRMMRQGVATKLLVLLPGETLAPGTPTGKTGTPIDQPVLTEFNVTVVMVDKDNYPVLGSTDVIHFASSGTGIVIVPPDTALVNGSITLPMSSWDESEVGGTIITASDLTNPTITSGSSTVKFIP
jgi:hypothetical protein